MALYALVLVEATLRILYGRAVSGLALDLLVVAAGLVAARRLDWWVPAPLAPAVRTFRRFRGAEVADPG